MARSVREIDRNEDKYVGIRFPLDHSPEGFLLQDKNCIGTIKSKFTKFVINDTR